MFKTFFSDQVLRRSPTITDDYQRSPAFTQRSSGAIPATMDDYQRFLKRHRTLTRTLWCDGALSMERPCLHDCGVDVSFKSMVYTLYIFWMCYLNPVSLQHYKHIHKGLQSIHNSA